MSREELNEMIYGHLEAIRQDVKAYAEGIGVDFKPISLYVKDNYASAFAIYDEDEMGNNRYLIDMIMTDQCDKPEDSCGSNFVE